MDDFLFHALIICIPLIYGLKEKKIMKSVFLLVGDYWHSAESIRPIVEFLFNKDEWKVIFTEKPEEIYNLSTKPELVISFKDPIENDQIPTDVWCDDKWNQKLFDLVENNGTELILAHAAVTDLERTHCIVEKMIQAMFIMHPERCTMEFIKREEHPVMDGVENFTFPESDEQYQMEMIENAEIQVLADTKTKHGVQPAVWVSELGKGRICCMTPAHVTENLTCDGFTRIMKNAIKWCSTD